MPLWMLVRDSGCCCGHSLPHLVTANEQEAREAFAKERNQFHKLTLAKYDGTGEAEIVETRKETY